MADFPDLRCDEDKDFLKSDENTLPSKTPTTPADNKDKAPIQTVDPDILCNEDEYIQLLIQRESSNPVAAASSSSSPTPEYLKTLRSRSIQWILKTREDFNFQFETVFLAIAYFDQCLAKKPITSIDGNTVGCIQILTVACVIVAAKVENMIVPPLVAFCRGGYQFEKSEIKYMELSVLYTLDWRMATITPFAYIAYFLRRLSRDEAGFGSLEQTAITRALDIVTEINTTRQRPSTIAAAAVLGVLDGGLTRHSLELKMNLLSSCGPLQIENVFTCYHRMVELELQRAQYMDTPPESSSNITSTDFSSDGTLPESSSNVTGSNSGIDSEES